MSNFQMGRQARKGDRAVIVGLQQRKELNGLIVNVLSDPHMGVFRYLSKANTPLLVNTVDFGTAADAWRGDRIGAVRTANLLVIPPDEDLKTMFGDADLEDMGEIKQREKAVDA